MCPARQTPPAADPAQPAVAVIACAVMETEVEHLINARPNVVAYHKLGQGLHNEPDRLRVELQRQIDLTEAQSDAAVIVLVYGLCSRGVEGVRTTRCRLVVPRAHDCITLLLGSRQRYAQDVAEHPGTYWYSPGWNRHHLPPGPQRYRKLREQYVAKFGEDNADFLMDSEHHWFSTYSRATYVHLTLGDSDADRRHTRECARWLGWSYDEQTGDPALLEALLHGPWPDEDFLVLEPGQTLTMTADERIIRAASAEERR